MFLRLPGHFNAHGCTRPEADTAVTRVAQGLHLESADPHPSAAQALRILACKLRANATHPQACRRPPAPELVPAAQRPRTQAGGSQASLPDRRGCPTPASAPQRLTPPGGRRQLCGCGPAPAPRGGPPSDLSGGKGLFSTRSKTSEVVASLSYDRASARRPSSDRALKLGRWTGKQVTV